MSSLDRILPFLRPIEDLLLDPTVTEVMVNDGGRRVFVERDGTAVHFFPSEIDPMENDGGCRLGVDDIDVYYEEYREHVYAELEEKPWGTREFAVLDPTRNLIWPVERSG